MAEHSARKLKAALGGAANPERAKVMRGFFKTGKGEYGEGDVFLGVTVPDQRKLARKFRHLPFKDTLILLHSKVHEHRLTALLILVLQYERADVKTKKNIVNAYLKNAPHVNNWDLVDSSAPYILGDWLLDHPRGILTRLARSRGLWERRIAILATFTFIKHNQFRDTLAISAILLKDAHDLIHKAVGWMLREVGDRDRKVEEAFLKKHAHRMPRTMLRYAIEKFPEARRKFYLRRRKYGTLQI